MPNWATWRSRFVEYYPGACVVRVFDVQGGDQVAVGGAGGGLAALTHYSHAGVATGTATLVDHLGPIGSAIATGLVNPGFSVPTP